MGPRGRMSRYAHDEGSKSKNHIERLADRTVAHVVMDATVAKIHHIAQVEGYNGVSGTAPTRCGRHNVPPPWGGL
jgi:hypothetical protein